MRVDEVTGRWWKCNSCGTIFKFTIIRQPLGNPDGVTCPVQTFPACGMLNNCETATQEEVERCAK